MAGSLAENYTISAVHADLGRFGSVEDSGFKKVVGELRRWVEDTKSKREYRGAH
jgi:hypothetical protein